jgi:hypothetical protein
MELVKVYHREDFGDEYVLALLRGKNYSFIQVSVGWNVYGGGFYSQASSGYGRILSFIFSLGHFDFAFDFCANTWDPDGYLDEDADEDPGMPPWGHSDLEYQIKNEK